MKLGFFGDGTWAVNSLIKIKKIKKINIKFICIRYDKPDYQLVKFGKKNNLKIICIKDINNKKFINFLKLQNLDLLVSMSYNQIFKEEIISLYKKRIINCHAGLLPFYRGRSPLNWVLIKDEKYFGITVHFVNKFIDKGDIILQKKFRIIDSDNYKTLLLKSYYNCPKILTESIQLILKNKVKPIIQNKIDKIGSYFKKRNKGDEIINWKQKSREIFCFIRALTYPSVVATTYYGNRKILIKKAQILKKYKLNNIEPGTILKITNNFFIVKTMDTAIKVSKWNGIINNKLILK